MGCAAPLQRHGLACHLCCSLKAPDILLSLASQNAPSDNLTVSQYSSPSVREYLPVRHVSLPLSPLYRIIVLTCTNEPQIRIHTLRRPLLAHASILDILWTPQLHFHPIILFVAILSRV